MLVVASDQTASGAGCSERDAAAEQAGAAVIAGWGSRSLSPAAQTFVRGVVASAAPGTRARAKALLFAAAKLTGFGEQVGLELSAGVLLHRSVIERFILTGTGTVSPATRRTLRTNLRALARAIERYPEPAAVPLERERAKRPYSPGEIAGYLRLADAQSTHARRLRASALICLGAGAGIITGELRHVRGSDVVMRAGGVLMQLSGVHSRSVPVLERYHERLLEAAAFAGERYLIGGRDPDRRNVTDALSAALSTDSSLPRLQAGRLRSTWLVECARRIGLGAFMQAAGVSCSQRLGDLAAQLPQATEDELIALLSGNRP
jgi:integrase